jgi:CubicO group peptidase (beta-lactamase class C family)
VHELQIAKGTYPARRQTVQVVSPSEAFVRNRHLTLLALLLFLTPALVAQPDRIDIFIKSEMQRQNIPGLSLAVLKGGQVVKTAGYGVSDMKLKTPATTETVYKIASVSKQFIAAGIMLLVQDGQLRLDDPIRKYLKGSPDEWKAITVRHLLTHTSGLVRDAPGFDAAKVQLDAEVIQTAYDLPLRFAPGDKWEYSNLGYFILAEVIRKVSNRHWSEYLAEKIFKPCEMTMTYPTSTGVNLPTRAVGYSDNNRLLVAPDWRALRPSGAFFSTVADLAKWDAALDTDKILTDASRRQMWTPVTLNNGKPHPYGFGWELVSFRDRRLVYHSGGVPGFRAQFARFADDKLTVIVLMNLDDVDPDVIVRGVASIYLP